MYLGLWWGFILAACKALLAGGDCWDSSIGVAAVCNCNDWEENSGAEWIIFFLLNTVTHMYMDDGDKFQIL